MSEPPLPSVVISPYFDNFRCAWGLVAPDKSEALFTAVIMRKIESGLFFLKFAGLDKNKFYKNSFDGEIYSGALLMNSGINISGIICNDGDSIQIYLAECKD